MATLAEVLRQAGYVTPQGQVTGPRTDLAQKLKSYVMNIPQNAAQNLANQRADIDAALTMGQGGIQIGDREAFARQMAQVPNLMGLTAYHGTPHTIKGKFDISKVGTGEGAQAYGHGMYFAENPAVAKSYIVNKELQKTPEGMARSYVQDFPSEAEALSGAKQRLQRLLENDDVVEAKIQEQVVKALESGKLGGNLYKVDIPDEYIPNMLDWDKPLLQQTPQVQEALAKLGIKSDAQKLSEFDDALLNALLNDSKATLPKEPINPTGQDIYQTFIQGNPQYTSQRLGEVGIRGIRYLDEGSRKSGKGTSNFVVFDPSEVKILEQNSKPMTRKEIIEQELEKVAK